MAEIVRDQRVGVPETMRTRWADMGDGTNAAVVYNGANIKIGGEDVSASNPLITENQGNVRTNDADVSAANPLSVDNLGNVRTGGADVETTNPLAVQIGDGTYTAIIDDNSSALVSIDFPHHELHEGRTFVASNAVDLGNAASRDILIVAPDISRLAHLVGVVNVESESHIYFYCDTVVSANGTVVPSHNRDLNSGNTATVSTYHTPTVTNVGTLKYEVHLGSGRGIGGEARAITEWILKRGANHLLRVTNATAVNNYISINLDWYEHIPASA